MEISFLEQMLAAGSQAFLGQGPAVWMDMNQQLLRCPNYQEKDQVKEIKKNQTGKKIEFNSRHDNFKLVKNRNTEVSKWPKSPKESSHETECERGQTGKTENKSQTFSEQKGP